MRRVDGAKVTRLTPGDLLVCHWLVKSRDVTKGKQKSAEVIVAAAHGGEEPNTWSRTGAERSMPEGDADKMAERPERTRRAGGGTAEGTGRVHQAGTVREGNVGDGTPMLMEEVCARENLLTAYRRVVRNKGAPGIDGMTVEELMPYCRRHWSDIREELLNGRYEPQPVRRADATSNRRHPTGRPCIPAFEQYPAR